MLSTCALVVALACLAVAQPPPQDKCVTPTQWTGVALVLDPAFEREGLVSMVYDAEGLRTFMNGSGSERGEQRPEFYEWSFFKPGEEARYLIVGSMTDHCQKLPLRGEWRPIGVPADAELYRKDFLGDKSFSDHAGISLEDYAARRTGPGGLEINLREHVTALKNPAGNCVPVIDSVLTTRREGRDFAVVGYEHFNLFDVNPGIDTKVFDLPAQCK